MAFILTALTEAAGALGASGAAAGAAGAGAAATGAEVAGTAAVAGEAGSAVGATSRLASMSKGINEAAEGIKSKFGVTPEHEKMAQEHSSPASSTNATAGMGAGGTSLTGY